MKMAPKSKKFKLVTAIAAAAVIGMLAIFPLIFEEKVLLLAMFGGPRFVLLCYIFFSLNLYFVEQQRYQGDLTKLFYQGTLYTVFFTVFAICGLFLANVITPQNDVEGYKMGQTFLLYGTKILGYGMLYTVLCLVWVYFHPHNGDGFFARRAKRKAKK